MKLHVVGGSTSLEFFPNKTEFLLTAREGVKKKLFVRDISPKSVYPATTYFRRGGRLCLAEHGGRCQADAQRQTQ